MFNFIGDRESEISLLKFAKLEAQCNKHNVAEALKLMTEKLRKIISEISVQAGNTANASKQFYSASERISDGANSLASASEEVASSIEEMSSNIMQNSENAQTTENISELVKLLGIDPIKEVTNE